MTDWQIPTQPPGDYCYACGRRLLSTYAEGDSEFLVVCLWCELAWPTGCDDNNASEVGLRRRAAALWKQRKGVLVQGRLF